MGEYVASQTVKQMIRCGTCVKGSKVNVLGLTFKENVPDLRNSRVIDVINELRSFGIDLYVHDPLASREEAMEEYGVELVAWDDLPVADAVVAAVVHDELLNTPVPDYLKKVKSNGCFIDVKARFDRETLQAAGLRVWRL
jgi:UDP-N-acetyl-D-galactosamine dehydrogenase